MPNGPTRGEAADVCKDAPTASDGKSGGLTIAAYSDLFLIQRAEDALRPNHEDDDENGECDRVAIRERDVAAAENLRHAQRDAAETRAEHTAHATEDGRDESLDPRR